MWRYVAGGSAVVALVAAAGLIVARSGPGRDGAAQGLPPIPSGIEASPRALPASAPEATPQTRERRRFARYDKDRDGGVTRDEYLAQRRKAYARLDSDGDGRLSFDEWAIKATTKFGGADRDKSGSMNRAEFATTAVTRKPAPRNCPPARSSAAADEEG